jgi:hypothetical protein
MSYYPGGVEGHANHLREEGFMIDATGKAPKVKYFKESLGQSCDDRKAHVGTALLVRQPGF